MEAGSTLEEFYEEISRSVIPDAAWGHNLDGFNDILRGGLGTPAEGFTLHWLHHAVSKQRLGYLETARQLQLRLASCHPTHRDRVTQDLAAAHRDRYRAKC